MSEKKYKSKPFTYYKENVSLVDLMLSEKYKYKESTKSGVREVKRSTSNSPRLEVVENGKRVDVITISTGVNGTQKFWSHYNNHGKSQSVFDFVIDQENLFNDNRSLLKARTHLDKYINSEEYIKPSESVYRPTVERSGGVKDNAVIIKSNSLEPLVNKEYLLNRGISEATLNSPEFAGKIFSQHFYHKETKTEQVNTIFPMIGEKGIQALSKKNKFEVDGEKYNFKGFSNRLGASAWISNNKSKELDNLIIVESAEDALSHYQMNIDNVQDKSVRYFSFEGEPSQQQIDFLQKIVDTQQPKLMTFGMDNDAPGQKHIFNTLLSIKTDNNFALENRVADYSIFNKANIKVGKYGKTRSDVVLNFELEKKYKMQTPEELVKNHKVFFEKLNDKYLDKLNDGVPFEIEIKDKPEGANIYVSFSNNTENWEIVNDSVLEQKFKNNEGFKIEKPFNNDFNDDLQEDLQIGKFKPMEVEALKELKENKLSKYYGTKKDESIDKLNNGMSI